MAKRKDASKALGGMSGKAAAGLRGRAAKLKEAESYGLGTAPAKKKLDTGKKMKRRPY